MKHRKTLFFIVCGFVFFSCKRDINPTNKEKEKEEPIQAFQSVPPLPPSSGGTRQDYLKLLTQHILLTAQNSSDFQSIVYQECFATESAGGDYEVKISRLLELNNRLHFFSGREINIQTLVNYIKNADVRYPEDPVIFVPFIEDRDPDSVYRYCTSGLPLAVVATDYNPSTAECPSYALDESGALSPTSLSINEEYAWNYPVWVVNQQEVVSAPTGAGGANQILQVSGNRIPGYREFGGIIQVPHLGDLEPWISGKFEFKYIVYGQGGVEIKKREFPKVKRKYLKDSQWYDLDDFLCYWNTNSVGIYMVESWLELDGGSSTDVTQNFPSPCQGCPSTSFTYQIGSKDDEMGYSIVQFSDPTETVYNITSANFKRKNIQ